MRIAGLRNRLSGIITALLGVFVAVSACGGAPKREFGTADQAGRAGSDYGGQGGVGGTIHGGAGSSSGKPGSSGTEHAAGAAGDGETDGQLEAGAGGDAFAGGMASPMSKCLSSAMRSCAEAGLLGTCAAGTQSCGSDGMWGSCSVTPKPKDTCISDNDDSCNGIANEGCDCVIGAQRPCIGAKGNCANGKQTCPDGSWSACSITPKTQDACAPGDDANCNGTPNEGCDCKDGAVQTCTPQPVGICKPGTSTCSGGAWGGCVGTVVAATRDCSSSLDNDCNGIADAQDTDSCKCTPGAKQTCGAHSGLDGKGICKAGSQTCVAASNKASSSWDPNCPGSVGPMARDCGSAADNDCNGVADNTKDSVCQCNPNLSSSCAAGTKCTSSGTAAQCVTCVANSDCSNGGTCNSAAACVCSVRFNGPHCEFQVFRGIGMLPGDTESQALGINQDGSVVVGLSGTTANNAVRSVNAGALQLIQANTSAVGASSDTTLMASGALYSTANGVFTPNLSPTGGTVADLSRDGTTMVGTSQSQQAFRKVGSAAPVLLGVLVAGGTSAAVATSGDGSVVVGSGTNADGITVAVRWTAATGLVALPALGWANYEANDVSSDGKVIVGTVWDPTPTFVRWSGTPLVAVRVAPALEFDNLRVNGDGSVMVGTNSSAVLWDSSGQHTVQSLLGSTTDVNGWTLRNATGVSDDGKFIVGIGAHGGVTEGWAAHLP